MNRNKELKEIVEKSIDFTNISVQFKKDKHNKLKLSIRGLRKSFRNPILAWALHSSIFARISSQIPEDDRKELYMLYKNDKQKFEKKFYEIVISMITDQLREKLESDDLPTPIFPTSVALSEIPNYYICESKETYTLDTKKELFNKLAYSKCGKCGQRIYGVYIPEEWIEARDILENTKYFPDFYNANILALAGIRKINLHEIGPFEYVFYLLDRILQEMFRRNVVPDYHVELFVIEGVGGGKKFFSHYIIPNLNDVFFKFYHGDDRYTSYEISKIKALISSFLVENWNIDNNLKKNNSEIAHAYINRLLYFIFCHRKLDIDSILFLEDLKIKLGDTTPIKYLEEVISWM